MNPKLVAALAVAAGLAILIDTYSEGELQLPSWLWYATGGGLVIFGGGTLFKVL